MKFCLKIDFAEVFTWQLGGSSLGNFSKMAAWRVHLSGKQIKFLLVYVHMSAEKEGSQGKLPSEILRKIFGEVSTWQISANFTLTKYSQGRNLGVVTKWTLPELPTTKLEKSNFGHFSSCQEQPIRPWDLPWLWYKQSWYIKGSLYVPSKQFNEYEITHFIALPCR